MRAVPSLCSLAESVLMRYQATKVLVDLFVLLTQGTIHFLGDCKGATIHTRNCAPPPDSSWQLPAQTERNEVQQLFHRGRGGEANPG